MSDFDPGIAEFLDDIHSNCNHLRRLKRDPLVVVREFEDAADREVAAIVCSTLAFGGVDLIIRACRSALAPLGSRPARTLAAMSQQDMADAWSSFQYRFCFPKDMTALMLAAKRAQGEAGSMENWFLRGDPGGRDIVVAVSAFTRSLKMLGIPGLTYGRSGSAGKLAAGGKFAGGIRENLLPDPARGSACKRMFLFLRWMVRRDNVDPGGWDRIDRARLVVPLDLHMSRVCKDRLSFLSSTGANLRNALRATAAFRLYAPDDPVKYDFALTRPGIDPEPGDERYRCG
jgi:uncharacterized protein (TIGR02757 family)